MPPGTAVLIKEPTLSAPAAVTVDYPFGFGHVIATLTTTEWRYVGGIAGRLIVPQNKKLLANEIALGSRALGTDVSFGSSPVDFSRVCHFRSFSYLRATEGQSVVDSQFLTYLFDAKPNCKLVGAYHFGRPFDYYLGKNGQFDSSAFIKGAKDEAAFFLKTAHALVKPGNLPPVLDLENMCKACTNIEDMANITGWPAITQWIKDWCDTVLVGTGVRTCMIYAVPSIARKLVNTSKVNLTDYPLWIAFYEDDSPTAPYICSISGWWSAGGPSSSCSFGLWGNSWTFLQYGAQNVAISGTSKADLDVFNGDMSALTNFVAGLSKK